MRLGDGEAALVEGAADDRALDVGGGLARPAPRGRRGRRRRRRRSPAASVAAAIRLSSSIAGPSIVPSTSIAVQRKRVDPALAQLGDRVGRVDVAGLGPARQRRPCRRGRRPRRRRARRGAASVCVEELRVAQRRGADHDPLGARVEHRVRPSRRRAGRRRPGSGTSTAAAIRAHGVEVLAARPPWRRRGRPRAGTRRLRRPSAARRRPGRRRRRSRARSRPAAAAPPGRRGCRSPG